MKMLNSIFFLAFLFFIYISPIIIILYTIALVFVKYFKNFFMGNFFLPICPLKVSHFRGEHMVGNRSCEELPLVKSLGAVNCIILPHFCIILTKYEAIDARKFSVGCFTGNFRYLLWGKNARKYWTKGPLKRYLIPPKKLGEIYLPLKNIKIARYIDIIYTSIYIILYYIILHTIYYIYYTILYYIILYTIYYYLLFTIIYYNLFILSIFSYLYYII